MNAVIALILVTVIAALLWDLAKVIMGDGLGHRPPPPSHYDELDPGSPHRWASAAH